MYINTLVYQCVSSPVKFSGKMTIFSYCKVEKSSLISLWLSVSTGIPWVHTQHANQYLYVTKYLS
jgi:hypothetical protein